MKKSELKKEQEYLQNVLAEIKTQQVHYLNQYNSMYDQKQEFSKQLSEDFYEMDDEESLGMSEQLNQFDNLIYYAKQHISRLERQVKSPYFGRIDFAYDGESVRPFYIGVNNLSKTGEEFPLICDWRAPISSLFYDYELGRASFVAPDYGEYEGEISLKRQYTIKNSELINVFDSDLTIGDDVLKDMLAESSTNKMKTIVSTIQKEQNKIIRSQSNKNMLVQGVAGSGKTSIALHRIAYLLYQNKQNLKAEDVLILSPNKLFSNYISEVLPELGEENMSQMSFYRLAQEELKFIGLNLEKRETNLDEITKDVKRLNQVAYKHTYDFYESLQKFCSVYFDLNFNPKDLKFGETIIKAEELDKLYKTTYKSKNPSVRVEWLVDYIADKLNIENNISEVANKIKAKLYPFFEETNVLNIYASFLTNIGMTFSLNQNEEIRYDDLAPIMYIANYYFGLNKHKEVKYLIIDEMQDYSFVHYDIFNQIFDCNKTVLGDINQCIEKLMSYEDLLILKDMLKCELVEMNKAYRSTFEICDYSNNLKGLKTNCVDRHGEQVEENKVKIDKFSEFIKEKFDNNDNFNTFAILTNDIEQSKMIFDLLKNIPNTSLNIDYDEQMQKVCIMPSYMAKGLEFDYVFVIDSNKKDLFHKNLKYVSCTRAMHKLSVIKLK